MARLLNVRHFGIIKTLNKVANFNLPLWEILFFIRMNQKEKDESYMLVVMFWPIWVPVIMGLIFLIYLSR